MDRRLKLGYVFIYLFSSLCSGQYGRLYGVTAQSSRDLTFTGGQFWTSPLHHKIARSGHKDGKYFTTWLNDILCARMKKCRAFHMCTRSTFNMISLRKKSYNHIIMLFKNYYPFVLYVQEVVANFI